VSGIIQSLFSGEERGRAFGALGASVGLATAAGPVIGGLVIGAVGPAYGWRATFLVNVPIGTASFLLCRRLLPRTVPAPRARARLDLPGLALLSAGLFAVLYPTIQFDSSRDPSLALWWVPAAVLLTAFARWERGPARRRGQPLVDTGLFAIRSYSAGLGLALLYFSAYAGLPLVLALYLQDGLGRTPLASGLTASAYAIGAGVSAPVAGRFVARLGRRLIVTALVLFVTGVGCLVAVALLAERVGTGSVPWLLAGPLFLAGLGGGAVITPNQALSLARVDARGGSTAGGMLQTAQRIGSATGAAVLSAVFYASLHSRGEPRQDATPTPSRSRWRGARPWSWRCWHWSWRPWTHEPRTRRGPVAGPRRPCPGEGTATGSGNGPSALWSPVSAGSAAPVTSREPRRSPCPCLRCPRSASGASTAAPTTMTPAAGRSSASAPRPTGLGDRQGRLLPSHRAPRTPTSVVTSPPTAAGPSGDDRTRTVSRFRHLNAGDSMTDARDFGLLALRVGVGATLAAHGTQKLFGWFGGGGLAGTGGFFDSIGFTPGKANAVLAGAGEAGGGTLLALGLATPAAGAAAAGTMVVAATMHKENGFFAQGGGYEYPAVLALTAASLALGGPGKLSLDAALGHRVNQPWMRVVGLASIPVAVGLVYRRRSAALAAASATVPENETGSGEPPATTA